MKRTGFTLIELLLVISIIGLLSSVVFASLTAARMNARVAAGSQSNANIYHALAGSIAGEWLFDEGSGTTASDTSANNNDGTITAATYVTGFKNTGLSFNGSNALVSVPASSVLDLGTSAKPNLTLTAWVKVPAKVTANQTVAGRRGSYLIWLANSNQVVARLTAGGSTFNLTTANNTSRVNEWEFITLVYDGTAASLYVNGAKQTLTIGSFPGGALDSAGSNPFTIGSDSNARYFNGTIDEVRAYASVLTAEAIRTLYAQGAAKRGVALRQ